jgi:hypothetical protein
VTLHPGEIPHPQRVKVCDVESAYFNREGFIVRWMRGRSVGLAMAIVQFPESGFQKGFREDQVVEVADG